MNFQFAHYNYNVMDLYKSIKFYEEALGLKEVRRKEAEDGSFILAILHLRQTIWKPPIRNTKRWVASASKTRQWEFTLSMIQTDTGWRSCRRKCK